MQRASVIRGLTKIPRALARGSFVLLNVICRKRVINVVRKNGMHPNFSQLEGLELNLLLLYFTLYKFLLLSWLILAPLFKPLALESSE